MSSFRPRDYSPIFIENRVIQVMARPILLSTPTIIAALPAIVRLGVGAEFTSGNLDVENIVYPNFHRLRHWLFIEQLHQGRYLVLPKAKNFFEGRLSVPLVAFCYDHGCHKLDGPMVTYDEVRA